MDDCKDVVLASPETPADLATLNHGTHAGRMYKAFDLHATRFDSSKP